MGSLIQNLIGGLTEILTEGLIYRLTISGFS